VLNWNFNIEEDKNTGSHYWMEITLNQLLEGNMESENWLVRNDKKCKKCPTGKCKKKKKRGTAYVWKSLKDVFETKGMTSRVMLKTKLLSLKHQPS
jgi:hypothetical protein